MSAIHKAIADVTKCHPGAGETSTTLAYLKRLVTAVGTLPDPAWAKLSPDAQAWYNDAIDAIETDQALPPYPDAEPEAAAPSTRRRGAKAEPAASAAPVEYEPAKGDVVHVTVTTKRGTKEYIGEIVELDEQGIVLDVNGSDVEVDHGQIESIRKAKTEGDAEAFLAALAEPEGPVEPQVGDTVELKTKRGKIVVGKVTEITDDEIVVEDVAGEVQDFQKERLESIVVKVVGKVLAKAVKETAKAVKEEVPARAARAAKKEAPADDAPARRPGRPAAGPDDPVPVTVRMRELICENRTMAKDDVKKLLLKEDHQFKDSTWGLIWADTQKVLSILHERKMIK